MNASDVKSENDKQIESKDLNKLDYCDINKFKKFKWIEIKNIIDTNDVNYDDLDNDNKALYKLYEHMKLGALVKDMSFHKFYRLYSDDVKDWEGIVKLDKYMFREKLNNEYYLNIVYEDEKYDKVVRYDLIDFINKVNNIDIIESQNAKHYDYYEKLFVFTHEYLKDIEIRPDLKNFTQEGFDGDSRTIIYHHLFTDYNFTETMFEALFFNEVVKGFVTTYDSLDWSNWALSGKFLEKYNEEQGLIEQVIFKGQNVDFINEISVDIDKLNYADSKIIFNIYDCNNAMKRSFKATFIINKEYFLDDVLIEES